MQSLKTYKKKVLNAFVFTPVVSCDITTFQKCNNNNRENGVGEGREEQGEEGVIKADAGGPWWSAALLPSHQTVYI